MAEIGASLREARTRARIEIAEMEAHTKIRAKYLRALENEEWELLPGPTYIKSFLKTYGDALDLDGRSLVAAYKAGHEVPDLQGGPGPVRPSGGRRAAQSGPSWPRWALGALLVIALAAGAYFAVGAGDDGGEPAGEVTTKQAGEPAGDGAEADAAQPADTDDGAADPGEPVTVRVTATADVFVCARAGDRRLEPGRTLRAGQRTARLRGRELLLTLANARSAEVRIDGELAELPSAEGPLTVRVSEAGLVAAPPEITACRD